MASTDTVSIDADVLVIGGGFAGSWAALRAAELGARTVLVDKAYVSRSGGSTISGGVTTAPLDGEDLRPWFEEFVVRSRYLANQDRTWQLLHDQRERVKDMDRWGVPIVKDQNGNIRRYLSRGMVYVRCLQFNPKRAMELLREQMLSRGVRIVDRVTITQLLTSDGRYPTQGRVVGAVGFHSREGTFHVFRAKGTLLGTGHAHLRGVHGVNNDAGDGIRLAFDVGADLADLEFGFGGTFNVLSKLLNFFNYNVFTAHGGSLINALGERFMERYDPIRKERSELSRVVAAFLKEVLDGKGPIYMDFRTCDGTFWADLAKVRGKAFVDALLSGRLLDPRTTPIAIEPQWTISGLGGGVFIDLGGHASVPGLFAAGTLANNDATGTHQSAGIPTSFCFTSGYRGGEAAAREALDLPTPQLPEDLIEELRHRTFAPLKRTTGPLPDEVQQALLDIQGSSLDVVILNQERFAQGLRRLDDLREPLQLMRAPDPHELVKAYDAESGFVTLWLYLLSGQDRTESREMFYREDYPETNDDVWFCWHLLRRTPQGTAFQRAPISTERYPLQRPSKRNGLSPIAAMMRGAYDPAVHDI